MKKLLKTTVLVAAAFAFGSAVVACDDTDGPGGTQEPTKYAVSYAIGEGATGTAPTGFQKAEGEKFNLAAYDAATATFSKEGYTFDGWHDGTAKYAAGYEYTMPNKAVTFTAQWVLEGEEGEYTITYVLNGGMGIDAQGNPPTETNKNEGDTFTVAAAILRENYTFAGWSDGTDTYAAGATYTVGTSNVVLTAQWTPKPGIQLPEDEILEFEGDCTLPLKKGYMGDKGGENIVGIAVDTTEGNEYLYYKIKGASGWVKSNTKYFEVTNKQYMPDKYGADALYYEGAIGELHYYALIKPDFSELTLCDTDDNILAGGVFTKAGQDIPANVTVTFDINWNTFGVDNPPAQNLAYNATAQQPQDIPNRPGYTFDGWHVGSENGALFDFSTPVTSDITLVAKWTVDESVSYNITFTAPEGATGTAPTTITVSAGEYYTIPANTFEKAGWTFYKWKNVETGYYANVGANTYKASKNVEYVAVFQSDTETYTLTGGDYDSLSMLDDGNLVLDTYSYAYEEIADGVLYIGETFIVKLDTTAKTGIFNDGMSSVTKTAVNGATLTFDGYGVATLDGHTGTYVKSSSFWNPTLTLTFGEVVISDIPVITSYYGDIEDITLNATITIDGTAYVFGDGGSGGEEDPEEIPARLFGTFEGFYGPTKYTINVSATGVTVAVGSGEAVDATGVAYEFAYNYFDSLKFSADGVNYEINNETLSGTVSAVTLWINDTSRVTLDRVGSSEEPEEPETPEIPDAYIGVFDGTKDSTPYVVTITADAITVKIGDAEAVTAEITEYDDYEGFTIKLGEDEWYIANGGYGDTVDSIYLAPAENYSSGILCTRKAAPEIGSKLYDFAGETSTNGVKYGYASSSDAPDAFSLKYTSGGNESTKTFYWAKVYYNSATAVNNPNRLYIYIYYTSSLGASTTTIKDGDANVAVTNSELPSSQTVQVTTTSSFGGVVLDVDFSIIDGKRAMTITYGEGESVTWYEFTA